MFFCNIVFDILDKNFRIVWWVVKYFFFIVRRNNKKINYVLRLIFDVYELKEERVLLEVIK